MGSPLCRRLPFFELDPWYSQKQYPQDSMPVAEETPLHLATALGDGHEAAVTNVAAVVCTVPDNLG